MKRKLFTLLLAVMTSMSIIASADVIPSNDVLAKYYEPGKVCVCIFVPGNMACGDFVLTGSFNGWASNVADCAYFEPVIGYDGWYVTSFEPEADPDVTRSIQALPVMLDNDGKFNWDYKAVAATKVRGGVEVVKGAYEGEIYLINFSVDMPNVFKIDALYKNPCTAIYHNYTVTVISDGCDGYAVPFLAGAMTSWEFKQMPMNLDKTMELGIGVYSFSFKAAEESLFQIVSGLMNEEGEVVEQPGWNNDSYLQKLVDGKWVRMPGEDSQNNLYTHENAEIVIDLREEDLRWARCNGEVAENVLVRLKAPAGAPESVEIIGSFDGWTGSAMTLNGGVWEAIVSAKPSALFKFRSGVGEDSDAKWSNQIQVLQDGKWEDIANMIFQDNWVQGEGDFADYKIVDLDFSNNELYKWHLEQPIVDENVVTLIPSQFTVGENQENFNETVSGITVEIYPKTTITTDQFRVFKNSTISISAEKEINRIVFTCTADDNAKYGPGCFESQDGYSYEGKIGTWAGTAATTIAFTASTNQVRITKIEVYFNSDVPSDPLVLAPSILPKFGDFLNSVEVELSCSTESAKIYYTLDGTDPDANAILYNAPFILKESTLVRAIAILGENKSRVIEKNYNKVTPWTVEEAVSALKEFSPINNKFAKGIICQVDEWQNSWGSITYWISENGEVSDNNHMLEVFAGLGLNSEKFASIDALHVGDTVTIFGNLKIYRKEGKDDIYEFDQFSYLVKYKEVVEADKDLVTSGKCGANITWELSVDSVLSISGTGAMYDYDESYYDPIIDIYNTDAWFALHSNSIVKSVIINDGVTSIGNYAFSKCNGLTSVTIANSVTSIGQGAFRYCDSLTSIIIPNGVTSFGSYAFDGCKSLTSIEIPQSVTNIGAFAFRGCENVTSVTISNSVISIGGNAFNGCSSLTSVTIPNSVRSIGKGAFSGCTSLATVSLNSNTIVGRSYTKEHNLSDIFGAQVIEYIIGDDVTSIGSYAFYNCTSLTSVAIPNSVTSIEACAFNGCTGLTTIIIPNSVTSIGEETFEYCTSLTSITNYAIVPQTINSNVFSNVDKTACTLYVPEQSVAVYEASSVWKEFNIQVILSEPDTVTVAQALEIGNSLSIGNVSKNEYIIKGYVSSIQDYFNEGYETFWITDTKGARTSDKTKAFEVYRGKPNTEKEIGLDALIVITCKIKNYNSTIENDGVYLPFEVLEQGKEVKVDTVTVAQALEIGNALEDNAYTDNPYVVIGYVVKAYDPDEGKTQQNFYMADEPNVKGDFYAYRANPDTKVVAGDYVELFGKIQKYVGSKGTTIELSYGTAKHLEAPKIDTINVAQALEIGAALENGGQTEKNYFVLGYVAEITEEYDGEELQSFILSDDETKVEAEFEARNARVDYEPALVHDKVQLFGKILKDEKGKIYMSMPSIQNFSVITWEVKEGVLIISGHRAIDDYSLDNDAPWYSNRSFIKSIIINDGVKSIGNYAFRWFTDLTSVTIPNSVNSIGECAFLDCENLTSVTIPFGVTSIGTHAFYYCIKLTSIKISSSVTSIGFGAFGECNNLRTIYFDGTLTQWCSNDYNMGLMSYWAGGNLYINGELLTSANIPDGVSCIGSGAFKGCACLTSVTIPNSVTSIGAGAFNGCSSLTSVTIPNSVTSIGAGAFNGCSNLTSIYNYRTKPAEVGKDAFKDVDYFDCTLYVLAGSVDMYKSSGSDWKDLFFNIKPIEAESVTINDLKVEPSANSANIVWPIVSGAESYDLVIKDKDGNVICTLVFNAQGQLTSIAFNVQGRNATQQTQVAGFSFTVTGLEAGSVYYVFITAKDAENNELKTYSTNFKTIGGVDIPTYVDQVTNDQLNKTNKVIHKGQIYILRGDRTYTLTGQEVK